MKNIEFIEKRAKGIASNLEDSVKSIEELKELCEKTFDKLPGNLKNNEVGEDLLTAIQDVTEVYEKICYSIDLLDNLY